MQAKAHLFTCASLAACIANERDANINTNVCCHGKQFYQKRCEYACNEFVYVFSPFIFKYLTSFGLLNGYYFVDLIHMTHVMLGNPS